MVGFLGFLILALGGGGLALFFGVPPVFIGVYVVGLILIGAVTGFGDEGSGSSSSSTGSSRGSSGGGSSGNGSGSFLNSMADTASGIASNLSGSDSSSGSSRSRRETGSVSRANSGDRREVGSFGNSRGTSDDNVTPVSEHYGDDEGGTTDQDYLNEERANVDMADSSGLDPSDMQNQIDQMIGDAQSVSSEASDEADREAQEESQLSELEELMEKAREDQKQIVNDIQEITGPVEKLSEMLNNGATVMDIAQWANEHQGIFATIENDMQEIEQDFQELETVEEKKKELLNQMAEEAEGDVEELKAEESEVEEYEKLMEMFEQEVEVSGGGFF